MMTNRYWRLSVRRSVLLLLPIIIAFLVGGCAPILIGHSFNIFTGILWGFVIGVIDYNMLVLNIKASGYIMRLLLVGFSVLITGIVGDLIFFEKDISVIIKDKNDERFDDAIQKYHDKYAWYTDEMILEETGRDGREGGRGERYNDLKKQRESLDKPNRDDVEGGVLIKIEALHEYITAHRAAGILFLSITIFVVLLETLPLILKKSNIK